MKTINKAIETTGVVNNLNMPEKILAQLYNDLADTYSAGRHLFDTTPILKEFSPYLPETAKVLDAGCGTGEPVAKYFVENGHHVTGLDVSERMLELARKKVPQATFQKQDMTQMSFAENSYDAIAAVYSVFHLPRTEHSALFSNFSKVLKEDGMLLITLATKEFTGSEEFDGKKDFLGKQLFYSHDQPEVALQKLKTSGFEIMVDKLITTGGETFYWVIGRNNKSGK